jgi:hypothetical protein
MRFQKYLQEKYLATFPGRGDIGFKIGEQYREIYINPTPMEMKNLVKTSGVTKFRFVAVSREKALIVRPIRAEIHIDMVRWLQKKHYIKPVDLYPPQGVPRDFITGFIQYDGGKMVIVAPGEGHEWVEYSYELSPEWLRKYIANYDGWMSKVRADYHHYGYEDDRHAAGIEGIEK